MPTTKPCKDCGSTTRKTPHPGPRCASCHRAVVAARREASWALSISTRYGITDHEYKAILSAQLGKCAICQRATGATRRLAVDHDHAVEAEHGVRASVRGLLCKPCNRLLGHARDEPAFFERAIAYLTNPPARQVL